MAPPPSGLRGLHFLAALKSLHPALVRAGDKLRDLLALARAPRRRAAAANMDRVWSHVSEAGADADRTSGNASLGEYPHARGISRLAQVELALAVIEDDIGRAHFAGADVVARGPGAHALDAPAGCARDVLLTARDNLDCNVRLARAILQDVEELLRDRQLAIGRTGLCLLYLLSHGFTSCLGPTTRASATAARAPS